jgi:hypothetical protein
LVNSPALKQSKGPAETRPLLISRSITHVFFAARSASVSHARKILSRQFPHARRFPAGVAGFDPSR